MNKITFLIFFISTMFIMGCSKSSSNAPAQNLPDAEKTQLQSDSKLITTIKSPALLNNLELKLDSKAPFTPTVSMAFELINTNPNIFSLLKLSNSEAVSIKINDSFNSGDGSEYIVEDRQITLSKSDCDNKMNDKISKVFVGVFIHEIGHSVLRGNFKADLAHEINLTNENDKKRFKLLFKNQREEADKLPQSLAGILSPFDELLADTYTVLLSKNPQIISDFQMTCVPEIDPKELRDFSISFEASGWNKGCISGGMMCASHAVFNPVRSQIWKIYQQFKDAPQIREKLFYAVYSVSIEMMQEIVAKETSYSDWKKTPIEQLNMQFLDKLNKVNF